MISDQSRAFSWVRGIGTAPLVSFCYVYCIAYKCVWMMHRIRNKHISWYFPLTNVQQSPRAQWTPNQRSSFIFPSPCLPFLLVPITDIPKQDRTKWHSNTHGESWQAWEGWRSRQEGTPQSWLEGDHYPVWSPAALTNSSPWFVKTVTTFFTLTLLVEIHTSTVLMVPSDDAQWTVQNGFILCAS